MQQTAPFTSFLWSLNCKPFGTGLLHDKKARLLEVFWATGSPDGPLFTRRWEQIAWEQQLPADKAEAWRSLCQLPSFSRKDNFVKLGRWFSWNEIAAEQLQEFTALKMTLSFHGKEAEDPTEDDPALLLQAAGSD